MRPFVFFASWWSWAEIGRQKYAAYTAFLRMEEARLMVFVGFGIQVFFFEEKAASFGLGRCADASLLYATILLCRIYALGKVEGWGGCSDSKRCDNLHFSASGAKFGNCRI